MTSLAYHVLLLQISLLFQLVDVSFGSPIGSFVWVLSGESDSSSVVVVGKFRVRHVPIPVDANTTAVQFTAIPHFGVHVGRFSHNVSEAPRHPILHVVWPTAAGLPISPTLVTDVLLKYRVGSLEANTQYFALLVASPAVSPADPSTAAPDTHAHRSPDSPVFSVRLSFRTLPRASEGVPVRLLAASCRNSPPHVVGAAIGARADGSHGLLSIGDNVYADEYWLGQHSAGARGVYSPVHRFSAGYYAALYDGVQNPLYAGGAYVQAQHSVGVFVSHDDHEVIDNWSGHPFADNGTLRCVRHNERTGETVDIGGLCAVGLPTFEAHLPLGALDVAPLAAAVSSFVSSAEHPTFPPNFTVAPQTAPKFYRRVRVGRDVELFILDLRTYRGIQGDSVRNGPGANAVTISPISPPPGYEQLSRLLRDRSLFDDRYEWILPLLPEAVWVNQTDDQGGQRAVDSYTKERVDPFVTQPRELLGAEQRAWLYSSLKESVATFKLIVSPYQITKLYDLGVYDRWEGFAVERQALLDYIETNSITGVVFISGDTHLSTVSTVVSADTAKSGKKIPIYEVSTGPAGQSTTAAGMDYYSKLLQMKFSWESYEDYFHIVGSEGPHPGATANSAPNELSNQCMTKGECVSFVTTSQSNILDIQWPVLLPAVQAGSTWVRANTSATRVPMLCVRVVGVDNAVIVDRYGRLGELCIPPPSYVPKSPFMTRSDRSASAAAALIALFAALVAVSTYILWRSHQQETGFPRKPLGFVRARDFDA